MRIPLLRGRQLTDQDNEKAPKVAVINEAMAKKLWPNQDPLGKRFRIQKEPGSLIEVVGVTKQGKYNDPVDDTVLFYYQPLAQNPSTFVTLQLRTGRRSGTVDSRSGAADTQSCAGASAHRRANHGAVIGRREWVLPLPHGARFTVTLGLLGLVLAVVGVYSVISYAAAQKTHEIGVRMALGAGRGDILKMVLRQGFVLVGAGLLAGLALTFLAGRGLGSLLVGVSPSDPVTLVVVALLLAAVGLVASFIPARRAMNIEPLRALKYE